MLTSCWAFFDRPIEERPIKQARVVLASTISDNRKVRLKDCNLCKVIQIYKRESDKEGKQKVTEQEGDNIVMLMMSLSLSLSLSSSLFFSLSLPASS